MDIFKLVGSIFINNQDANTEIDNTTNKAKSLSESIGSAMKQTGEKISGLGTKLLPVSLAIAGVGAVAVKSSAEVKAMNSQFEQTFGSLQNEASDAMNRVATESGILQTRLQGVGTSIYAFAKSSGADSAEAMSLMETALRATADASAYYDRSLEDTSESLMSFLKGNFANDAQLGVSCTETTRNAKAMELFGQKYNDLTEIQKQQTLLKMVTDAQALSGAMGQASRESDGFENVMGNLKESAKQAGAELGAVLLPTVIKLIQGLTGLIQKFTNMDDRTKKLIVTIAGIVAGLGPVLIIIGKVVSGIGTLVSAFGTIKKVIMVAKTAFSAFNAVLVANPIILIVTAIVGLVTAFVVLWNKCEWFRNFWIDLWEGIKNICSIVVEAVVGFFTKVVDFVKNNWQGLLTLLVNPIAGAFKLLWDNCEGFRNFWIDLWESIKDVTSKVVNTVVNFFTDLWNDITNIFNKVVEVVSNAWDTICNVVKVAGMFLGEMIGLLFDIITLPFRFIWENCKDIVIEAWNSVKETVSNAFTAVKNKIIEIGGNIKDKCSEIFGNVKDKVTTAWNNIKENTTQAWKDMKVSYEEGGGGIAGVTEVWFDTIKNGVCNAMDFISNATGINLDGLKETFTTAWFNIRNSVVDVLLKIQTAIPEIWESITNWLTTKFDQIKTLFTNVWNSIKTFVINTSTAIKTAIVTVFTAIKDVITSVMGAIKTALVNVWNAIKSVVTTAMNAVKDVITSAWNSVKTSVANVLDSIKTSISNGLNGAKETVSSVLGSIKDKFSSIFETVKTKVKSAIDYIKGLFNFSWSLPKLKLPHFSISGGFSLNPPSVPKFGISWYKDGGIMLDPTIFGINGNKLMAGGEAGEEAIAPIDLLLGYVRTAVAEQNASLIQCLTESIDSLGQKLSNQNDGDIVIPVYIGNNIIDELIVNSKKRISVRSGGLVNV